MNKTMVTKDVTPSELISEQIMGLTDWRGELLARLRKLILETDSGIVEEWKWGTAVWTKGGMICSGGVFKGSREAQLFQRSIPCRSEQTFQQRVGCKGKSGD